MNIMTLYRVCTRSQAMKLLLGKRYLNCSTSYIIPKHSDIAPIVYNQLGAKYLSTEPSLAKVDKSQKFATVKHERNEITDDGDDIERQRIVHSYSELFQRAWEEYKLTWEGFRGKSENEEEREQEIDVEDKVNEAFEFVEDQQKEIKSNVKKNMKLIKEEGGDIVDMLKDTTGIRTKTDAKKWAMKQLRLANECVAEFMKGYREGRDEEIDKMMNEYFKDIQFEEDELEENDRTTLDSKPGRKRRGQIAQSKINDD